MSHKKRVVITGMGVVSPAGYDILQLWSNILQGVSVIKALRYREEDLEHWPPAVLDKIPSKVAAQVDESILRELSTKLFGEEIRYRTISRSTHYALLAAEQAVCDSQLLQSEISRSTVGVAVGCALLDLQDVFVSSEQLADGYNRLSPFFMPRVLSNMAAGQISMRYGLMGPNHSVSTACATGAHSIGDAFRLVRNGDAVAMLCGGADASVNPLTVAAFCRLRALSTLYNDDPSSASRPFDDSRDGFVMGEGAAVLVLEEMTHALQRGARIHGEILGYGMSADAAAATAPRQDGEGAALAMRRALDDAGLRATDVTHVNAHATSTPLGDAVEANAISRVFGRIRVSSSKGCFGHLLGAAGAVETVCAVMACREGIIPATANLVKPCDADIKYVTNSEQWDDEKRIVVKNSFGFGGTNASLCVARFISS